MRVWRSASHLELGADGGPAVLGAALQRVLFVAALDVFKQVVDEIQPDGTRRQTVRGAKHAGRTSLKQKLSTQRSDSAVMVSCQVSENEQHVTFKPQQS